MLKLKLILLLLLSLPILGISDDDMKMTFEDRVQKIDDRGESYWILFQTKAAVYRLSKKSKDISLLKDLKAAEASKKVISVEADMDTMELSIPKKK
jgi:hypothetical protein